METGYDLKFKNGEYYIVNCDSRFDEIVLSKDELKLKIVDEIKKLQVIPHHKRDREQRDNWDQLNRMYANVCRTGKQK